MTDPKQTLKQTAMTDPKQTPKQTAMTDPKQTLKQTAMTDPKQTPQQDSPENIGFLATEGLAFLGKVNANISHELKNIVVIISETAALMADMAQMAEENGELDPGTVQRYCRSIMEDTQRGFATINHMNAFAHSVDELVKEVDLNDVLDLMVNLSKYLKFSRTADFRRTKDAPLAVLTSPFFLQAVLFHCFVFAFGCVSPQDRIGISARADGDAVEIVFSALQHPADPAFPSGKVKALAATVSAEVQFNPSAGELRLRIPKTMVRTG